MKTWRDEKNEYTTDGKETQVVKRDFEREKKELEYLLLRKEVENFNAVLRLALFFSMSIMLIALVCQIIAGA